MYLRDPLPTTGQPVLATQSTCIAPGNVEAQERYVQAWLDLRYADMGSAALDMRDLLAEGNNAKLSLFI